MLVANRAQKLYDKSMDKILTIKDFFDRRNAQAHVKQIGQREYPIQED